LVVLIDIGPRFCKPELLPKGLSSNLLVKLVNTFHSISVSGNWSHYQLQARLSVVVKDFTTQKLPK